MFYLFHISATIAMIFRLIHILLRLFFEALLFYIVRPIAKKTYHPGRRIRRACERLGPVYVKFGQILSTRWDILPQEVIDELEKLQSATKPFSCRAARATIKKNLKKPVAELFTSFDTTPLASASLGQVYKAKTKGNKTVAVKVQRPNALRMIMVDTSVLLFGIRFAQFLFPAVRPFHLDDAVKEFRRWTLNELNYMLEAANADIFAQHFEGDEHIFSPKVYWDYTARQVLTLEYVEGQSLLTIINTKGDAARKKKIASYGANAFMRQYFEFGFFHADPHPSNFFVLKNNAIYFLDFGMVGKLDPRLTELLGGVFLALLQHDTERIISLMREIHEAYADERFAPVSTSGENQFRRQAGEVIDQWFGVRDRKHNLTRIFYDLMQLAVGCGYFIPMDVLMMAKSIMTLDMVTKKLDPSFDLRGFEKPLIAQMVKQRLDPKRIACQAQNISRVIDRMSRSLPGIVEKLSASLARGTLEAGIGPRELAQHDASVARANSERSLLVIFIAVLAASVALVFAPTQLSVAGFPLSSVGFVVCFLVLLKALLFINHDKHYGYQ